ncbi:LOW QUALITY PROTEIN: coiled-coil domain-containing protein 181-like [Haliotis rubra]|uniref:LOW QUALITY PROTEIN: coiled-coil domain-containing protein 181-like n=1 Tax=Haliotis rubra TaxID=36100 RepID=UPI001EE6109B|nr:LOW QUALITY PROTEIN: coiled-coil domain-containing protein 181-like [Haliotis rubra]
MSAAVAVPPRIEVSDTSQMQADYDDDFEDFDKELDSFIASEDSSQSDNKAADDKESIRKQSSDSSDSQPEKGTEEIEKGQKEYPTPTSKTSASDGDDYTFSDDQKRAMMELLAQRQENDFPDEDPPEYDVKDRLIQLNAELAQESDPGERAHKVGFKETLVDLVAPPPDFSDDEDSQKAKSNPTSPRESEVVSSKFSSNQTSKSTDGKKRVVVEREGKFEVVNTDDLTPTERQMYVCDPDPEPPAKQEGPKKNEKNVNNCNIHEKSKQPSPPKQPRPATANGHTNRRALRPVQNKQRPKSAANQVFNESRSVDNFTYESPYALSPEQKELSRQRAKAMEDHKRDQDRRRREEKESEQKESDEAFQAWLKQKREEIRKRREREQEEKKKAEQTDKDWSDGEADLLTKNQLKQLEQEEPALQSFQPLFQKEENEAAFRVWLKEKRVQIRREKLLQHREDQEMKDGYQTVSRDECDRAFKEWVKKKNIESRKLKAVERQKSRSARISAKRSRRSASLLRAIRNSQSFQYVDYYGYRF